MTEIEIHTVNALQSACRGDEDIAATAVGLANWLCMARSMIWLFQGQNRSGFRPA